MTTKHNAASDPAAKGWIRGRAYTPILFVIVTLVLWYFFQLLTRIVITCLPGGDACLLGWPGWPLQMFVWPIPNAARFLYDSRVMDAIVSLVTLALALWPAIQIFFPPEDLTVPPSDTRDRAPSNT
jgi:hypothetical protein